MLIVSLNHETRRVRDHCPWLSVLSAISASSMYEAKWALYTAINVKTFNRDGPVSSGDVAGTNSGAFLFF